MLPRHLANCIMLNRKEPTIYAQHVYWQIFWSPISSFLWYQTRKSWHCSEFLTATETEAWAGRRWRASWRTFFTSSPRAGGRTRVQKRWPKQTFIKRTFFSLIIVKGKSWVEKSSCLQMAEALMLEMDGDSDGSITEEELVLLTFLLNHPHVPHFHIWGWGFSQTRSLHNASREQGFPFPFHNLRCLDSQICISFLLTICWTQSQIYVFKSFSQIVWLNRKYLNPFRLCRELSASRSTFSRTDPTSKMCCFCVSIVIVCFYCEIWNTIR